MRISINSVGNALKEAAAFTVFFAVVVGIPYLIVMWLDEYIGLWAVIPAAFTLMFILNLLWGDA